MVDKRVKEVLFIGFFKHVDLFKLSKSANTEQYHLNVYFTGVRVTVNPYVVVFRVRCGAKALQFWCELRGCDEILYFRVTPRT